MMSYRLLVNKGPGFSGREVQCLMQTAVIPEFSADLIWRELSFLFKKISPREDFMVTICPHIGINIYERKIMPQLRK